MGPQNTVRLGHEASHLSFEVPDGQVDEVIITAHLVGLVVSRRTSIDGFPSSLIDFVASLSDAWRGWDGLREWQSIAGDSRLDCYHDRIGHVVVQATLGLVPPQEWTEPGWSVTVSIIADPGSLAEVASGLRDLFAEE